MSATVNAEVLDPQIMKRLLEQAHLRRYRPKSGIIRQGSLTGELFYLLSGSVTVLIEDEKGHELVLAYLHEGEFFGEIGLFSQEMNRTAVVRARSACEVAAISYARLRAMPEVFIELLTAMSRQLAKRLGMANRKLGNLVFMDVSGRIARTLIELGSEPEAVEHARGTLVRVTRQELGRIVGCSREMASRVLKDMEESGLVTVDGKNIILLKQPLKQ